MSGLLWLALLGCGGADPDSGGADEVELLEVYDLADEVGFPEGLAWHPGVQAFFIGSIEHGGLTRVDPDGAEHPIETVEEDGWMSLGVRAHEAEVLVCAVRGAGTDTSRSELWRVDVESEAVVRVPLQTSPADCNDLVVVDGSAYLTDRESGRIHRVDLATNTSEIWLESEALKPGLIGNNGIVVTEGGALVVGQYSPARLVRVPLDAPEEAEAVELSGDSLGTLPNGPDGVVWHGDDLVFVANDVLATVSSSDDFRSADVRSDDAPVGLAAITEAQGQLFGLKGEVVPFVLGTTVDLPFQILAVEAP